MLHINDVVSLKYVTPLETIRTGSCYFITSNKATTPVGNLDSTTTSFAHSSAILWPTLLVKKNKGRPNLYQGNWS
jgi:hypothetical protein